VGNWGEGEKGKRGKKRGCVNKEDTDVGVAPACSFERLSERLRFFGRHLSKPDGAGVGVGEGMFCPPGLTTFSLLTPNVL
jgi:hypothetical protein